MCIYLERSWQPERQTFFDIEISCNFLEFRGLPFLGRNQTTTIADVQSKCPTHTTCDAAKAVATALRLMPVPFGSDHRRTMSG
jgi:hypothetical protein